MTKQILLLLTLLPLIGFGQTTTLSSTDVDSDGCVTVSDVLGVLQFYGQCSDDLDLERTWYYFHGFDASWMFTSNGTFTEEGSHDGNWYLYDNGIFTESVDNIDDAFQYLLDVNDSMQSGFQIQTLEVFHSITNNGETTQITFPATPSQGYYYVAIPNNTAFPEVLTQESLVLFPYPALQANPAASMNNLVINGQAYRLYRLQSTTLPTSEVLSFP